MKTRKFTSVWLATVLVGIINSYSQPVEVSSAGSKTTKLTPDQRQAYAAARDRVLEDAEYKAAVQRAIEAQKAADRTFFNKLLRAAPDLREYILQLQKARGLGPAADQP